MTAPVQQAIEALQDSLNLLDDARSGYIPGCGEDLKWDVRKEEFRNDAAQALAALRSLKPATEEEIAAIYNADDDIEAFVTAVKYFRAGEQFTRRRILGE